MNGFKIRKIEERKIIGMKFRGYIDFFILICCLIIAFNIHPAVISGNNNSGELLKMIYVFHDYDGNEYVMNDNTHGSSDSRDYLFNDEIPNDLKGDNTHGVYLPDIEYLGDINTHASDTIKDNQVSMDEILSDLGLDSKENETGSPDDNKVVLNVSDYNSGFSDDSYYTVNENIGDDGSSSLIIEKINDNVNEGLLAAKTFTFVEDGWIVPILVPWNDLFFGESKQSVTYNPNGNNGRLDSNTGTTGSGIEIIDSYTDCMTPWGYRISHGESVLAYEQINNTPDLCNIERRFCWKGKLSGTYTQQGCHIDSDYTVEQRGNNKYNSEKTEKYVGNVGNGGNVGNVKDSRQNNDSRQGDNSAVNVDEEIGGSFVFDRPSKAHTEFEDSSDNIVIKEEVDQTSRPYWDCTTPWGEKVEHGQFIQAFKHANGFTDAPCETQLRLCSMGELMGTFSEGSCKPRDVSFIDWINGVTTSEGYSREKLNLIRRQIRDEENAYKKEDNDRSTNSVLLDKMLWILDE